MKVKELDIKHPEWEAKKVAWQRLDLMLRGGTDIMASPELFLKPRPMEGADVYRSRCDRFTFEDVFGTGLGWYGARLFGDKAPVISFSDEDKTDQPDHLKNFIEDCDGLGNSLLGEAQQSWFPRAVAFGHMYIFIDRRKVLPDALSYMDQQQAGVFEPYVATFDPLAAINWCVDDTGALEWIIFKVEKFKTQLGKPAVKTWRWFYVDKEKYEIYEAPADAPADPSSPAGTAGEGDNRDAALVAEGPHAIAGIAPIVPVIKIQMPKQLAFGDRVYPIALDHVNTLNEWKWLHMQCCLAVPVITGADEEPSSDGEAKGPTQFSEITLIELPKGGTFGWSEPKGVALRETAERVQGLMEEIYRMMYLLAHARTTKSTPASQSGVSKFEDTRASTEVLDGFGNVLRKFLLILLRFASIIADKPKMNVTVGGMTFAEPDELGEIEEAQALLDANPPSDTLVKEIYKDLARQRLEGKPDDLIKKVLKEIDEAPTQSQQRAQMFAANANQFADQTTIFKGDGPVSPPPPSLPA